MACAAAAAIGGAMKGRIEILTPGGIEITVSGLPANDFEALAKVNSVLRRHLLNIGGESRFMVNGREYVHASHGWTQEEYLR